MMTLAVDRCCIAIGKQALVQDVSFTCHSGSITAIIGPNGAGKSTLMRGMVGIQALSGGRISLNDHDLHALSSQERAKRIAWVPQSSVLHVDLSVAEVVGMGRFMHGSGWGRNKEDTQVIKASLERCDAAQLLHRSFTTLSGGERARVLIARALASRAPVLCLDEPTASLDVGHALDCFKLCRELADDGQCIIMVLHQLGDVAQHTDRAILLHDGRLHAEGPSTDIICNDNLAAVYGVEMHAQTAPGFTRQGQA